MTIVRAAVGVLFLVSGVAKVVAHGSMTSRFVHWGVPEAAVAVWLIGALEIVCGTLFALGIMTRPVGLLLATVMVGAALTAGRADGGIALAFPIVVFACCVFFAWQSDRIPGVTPRRLPGVQ